MRDRSLDSPPAKATQAARIELVRKLTPVARGMALQYAKQLPPTVMMADLVAAAMLGLWQTVLRHGEQSFKDLKTLARYRMAGAMQDEVRRLDWLSRRLRWQVSAGEEAVVVGVMMLDDLHQIERRRALERLYNETTESRYEQDVVDRMLHALGALPDREAWIVALYYGAGVPLGAIAKAMRVTQPRVTQLHQEALWLMKQSVLARQDERPATSR